MRRLDSLFPPDFREWIDNLTRLYNWRQAGYAIPPDELTFEGWNVLALITRWYEMKDAEARMLTR